jgi:hypothetical protein
VLLTTKRLAAQTEIGLPITALKNINDAKEERAFTHYKNTLPQINTFFNNVS